MSGAPSTRLLLGATARLAGRAARAQGRPRRRRGHARPALHRRPLRRLRARAPARRGRNARLAGGSGEQIPANYLPWLQRAATRYELGPRGFSIVAAVHSVESDFGRSNLPGVRSGTNSAGAAGPRPVPRLDLGDLRRRRRRRRHPRSLQHPRLGLRHRQLPARLRRARRLARRALRLQPRRVVRRRGSREGRRPSAPKSSVAPAPELGEPPSARLARLIYYARWIESRRLHYCWGGGHAPKPGPSPGTYCWSAAGSQVFGAPEAGLDCSGAVRWLLVLAGYPDPGALVSNELGAAYPSGAGARFTIWANVDHVFVTIDGRDWGTSETNFAHGPGFADHSHAGFSAESSTGSLSRFRLRGLPFVARGACIGSPMRSQTATAALEPEAQRALRLLSEQVAVPLDQLARLLDVSMERAVRTVQQLEAAGCLEHRRFLIAEGPWFWLSHRGVAARRNRLSLSGPDVASLAHRRALNEIRIYLSERAPEGRWLCERMVYRRRDPNDHLPDALFEIDGERHAIEAELSRKSDREIRQILTELSDRYDAALYFCGPLTYRMMKRLSAEGRWPKLVVRRLPEGE